MCVLFDDAPRQMVRYLPSVGAAASILSATPTVEPGREASWDVRVRNTGSLVDQFTFEILGAAQPWTTVDPPTLELLPNTEGNARLTFRPPRSSTVPAGPLVVGVKAASREDPDGTIVEEATLEVSSFIELFVELVPRTSKGAWRGKHEIGVDNRGNVPLNALVTASDPDEALRFEARPPSVAVEPGSAVYGRLKVRPRKRFLFGQPKTVPFDAHIQPQEGEPVAAQGNLLQTPIIPRWAPQAIATLIGLVIAWLTLLQPAIESQARDAVADPLAKQGEQVSGLQKAVEDLERRVPDGPGPTSLPTSGPSLLGRPFDGRLAADVAKTSTQDGPSYPLKSGESIVVTDLVLQNPQGDTGALFIRRGNAVLLQIRLENFRDLDYHFVTPLIFGSKSLLNLRVTCDTPGLKQDRCRPAIYVTGTINKTS